jgi:hypothetical protein
MTEGQNQTPTPENPGTIKEQNERIAKAAESFDQEVQALFAGDIDNYVAQTGGVTKPVNTGRKIIQTPPDPERETRKNPPRRQQ